MGFIVRRRALSLPRRGAGVNGWYSGARAFVLILGTVLLTLAYFPLLLFVAAVVMLVVLAPLFIGAHLEYGFVPGAVVRGASLSGIWYVLTAVWIVGLIVGPVAFHRLLRRLSRPHRTPEGIARPRPRV